MSLRDIADSKRRRSAPAGPAPEIITALAELGANFDLASRGEIDLCFGLSTLSERLSFGNTIKRESAIAKSWTDGIGLFAFDSIAELAGPTCDSTDVLYRRHPYELPLDLEIGDTVDFLSAGAYTGSVPAVAFNGFPPIQTYFV